MKTNREDMIVKFVLKSNINNFKIAGFNDASLFIYIYFSSQGVYIIYLVNEIGECSSLSWQSKKLQRIVKSVMAS